MAKLCTPCTGKLPPKGLFTKSVFRITDRPGMTSVVYRGRQATNQIKQEHVFFLFLIVVQSPVLREINPLPGCVNLLMPMERQKHDKI